MPVNTSKTKSAPVQLAEKRVGEGSGRPRRNGQTPDMVCQNLMSGFEGKASTFKDWRSNGSGPLISGADRVRDGPLPAAYAGAWRIFDEELFGRCTSASEGLLKPSYLYTHKRH